MIKNNPKSIKYGRVFRIKLKDTKSSSSGFESLKFYSHGIKALENSRLTIEHLNSINRLLKRLFKKNVNVKYNISMIIPVTKKPLEARLGGGKADRSY
jgi:ribosomal protein L16/L10AE